ncbi:serine hydrolase domain-containing protein [Kribbella sp. NPDC055071]
MRRTLMRYRLIIPMLAFAALLPAGAAGADESALGKAVHQTVTDGFTATVVQVRDGAKVTALADGVADVRTGEPARVADRFRIASNTKSFVSTVVLQLEAEGRLSINDSASRWFHGLDRRITLRQLLNHTSGVYDPTTERGFWTPYLDRGDRSYVYTPDRVIAMALAHQPTNAPGETYAYSNTNYLIIGKIIEKVTGHTPAAEIAARLLKPLGLRNTYFPTIDPFLHGPHLHGYDLSEPMQDMTTFSPSYDWTAGAMVSTVDDLSRFHRALFGGLLLPATQQKELLTTVPSSPTTAYGLGVEGMPSPCGDGVLWGATGSGPGFTSVSMSTADGRRQLVLVGTRFDVAKELADEFPIPVGNGYPQVLQAAFC